MRRNRVVLFSAGILVIAVGLVVSSGVAVPAEVREVFVTNFPDVQRVEGDVGIRGPISQAALVRVQETIVSPVRPTDTVNLIPGGILVTNGYGEVALSLTGQVKGEVYRPGSVGAILLPDEEPIVRAFDEKGQTQFALEVTAAGVSGAAPYFASNQPRFTVGFPRYRVFFYNTSDKTVTVDLFAYLIQ